MHFIPGDLLISPEGLKSWARRRSEPGFNVLISGRVIVYLGNEYRPVDGVDYLPAVWHVFLSGGEILMRDSMQCFQRLANVRS